jgi:Xaa-Pro aminopeptidase
MDKTAQLIIAASEGDANMLYATRFFVPDPFIFLAVAGRKIVVMSDLEVDRARSQAKVDEVISFSKLAEDLTKRGVSRPGTTDVIDALLKDHGVRRIEVPGNFPVEHADRIRARGYEIVPKAEPFFGERTVKADDEIAEITQTLRHTEQAIEEALKVIRASEIKGNFLDFEGDVLTAEAVKKILHVELMKRDCLASHTIVAPGVQGVDPHNEGSGPLFAHQSIIMDVFPHSLATHYYADITRTVVRGRASDKLKRMFDAVREGQEIAFGKIRAGADGSEAHRAIVERFEALGFHTGEMGGRMQGFFHGTGHGVGLEIHEPPRVSPRKDILKSGQVVTVEPGLYYLDSGGVRLEDMVVVGDHGNYNLTQLPKQLEI